jgi:hypothetical protein
MPHDQTPSAVPRQRFYFPQDELWKAASELKLTLLRIKGTWALEYQVSGTIGPDPLAGPEDEDTDGGSLEEPDVDPGALLQAIVGDLTRTAKGGHL